MFSPDRTVRFFFTRLENNSCDKFLLKIRRTGGEEQGDSLIGRRAGGVKKRVQGDVGGGTVDWM